MVRPRPVAFGFVCTMISPDHCRLMARYNAWQNASIVGAAATLDDAARQEDRGAFFGSIEGTLNHILWGDTIWMSRFAGWKKPAVGIPDSPKFTANWMMYRAARGDADQRIERWAEQVTDGDIAGDLIWFSGALNANVQKPKWLCIQHFFNHQTHHRGQVHAMLTAAGAKPDDTDLFAMPEDT